MDLPVLTLSMGQLHLSASAPHLSTPLVAGGLDTVINNSNNERVCSKRNDFVKLRF